MNDQLLEIDVSIPINDTQGDDVINIRLSNNEVILVNFSKLVGRSKYILDKYKYSEALNMMQNEIDEFSQENKIESGSIKYFFQLIQSEKVNIPIEHYRNLYILSEHFNIPKFIIELDKISQQKLFTDLNFTIQFFQNLATTNSNQETKMTSKIENFLSTRINECLTNSKLQELSITTISRIIEKSDSEKIDHNFLIEFIMNSIETRFTFLRFVSLDKMREENIDEFFKFIEKEEEHQQEIYLQYLPFNLSFIKKMKNKYEKIFNEFNQTKEELNQTKIKFERLVNENKKEKEDHEQTKIKLNHSEEEKEKMKEEFKQTRIKFERLVNENKKEKEYHEQTKIKLNHSEEEKEKMKEELKQIKKELEKFKMKTEMKHLSPSIVTVGGENQHNQLVKSPNNKNKRDIKPPLNFQLDPSPLLSFSVYYHHSTLITSNGSLKGIGYNEDGRITSSIQKTNFDHFTDISIKDRNGGHLNPISAVCYGYGTLYMLSKTSETGRQLVLCNQNINEGDPIFLDIGNHHPVALFGGRSHSASITSEGEVIFINSDSVKNSPNSTIESVSLPDNEKASSVAFCEKSVFVLSSNGRVFESPIEERSSLSFSEVLELSGKEIICLSGTFKHIFAVSKEGRVFGRGSNNYGRLGLGEGIKTSPTFTEISSLVKYKIRAVYAGAFHSLFETSEGKILSCGSNDSGQLLLSTNLNSIVYSPTETTISKDASFCIAGNDLSVVFIGGDPPPNTPNMKIKY